MKLKVFCDDIKYDAIMSMTSYTPLLNDNILFLDK